MKSSEGVFQSQALSPEDCIISVIVPLHLKISLAIESNFTLERLVGLTDTVDMLVQETADFGLFAYKFGSGKASKL